MRGSVQFQVEILLTCCWRSHLFESGDKYLVNVKLVGDISLEHVLVISLIAKWIEDYNIIGSLWAFSFLDNGTVALI